jgi:hypothetical protein
MGKLGHLLAQRRKPRRYRKPPRTRNSGSRNSGEHTTALEQFNSIIEELKTDKNGQC